MAELEGLEFRAVTYSVCLSTFGRVFADVCPFFKRVFAMVYTSLARLVPASWTCFTPAFASYTSFSVRGRTILGNDGKKHFVQHHGNDLDRGDNCNFTFGLVPRLLLAVGTIPHLKK